MTYADRQQEHDATYTAAYKTWVTSLPPDQRAAGRRVLEDECTQRPPF